jgi:hypothetical protein
MNQTYNVSILIKRLNSIFIIIIIIIIIFFYQFNLSLG